MKTRGISAYNLARGTLLNSKLTLADSGNQPLRLLDIVVSGMGMDPSAGLWLTPLHATPAVPRVFPFDLIYLDKEYRVVDTAEMGPGIDFPAFHPEISSALVLPSDTLHRTKTAAGDHLIVCASNDLEAILAASALPSPDMAEVIPYQHPASVTKADSDRPGTIELTPERPSVPTGAATAFDQSVLTAVAKVAETRSTEPKPITAASETPVPGPSMDVTDAVLDSTRRVQPAVVEHRIDPEDLFSNWVATAPPALTGPRNAPPEPPAPSNSAAPPEEVPPEPPKQNGRKGKPPADARSASVSSPAGKPKSKPTAPSTQGDTGAPVESRPGSTTPANEAVPTRTPVPIQGVPGPASTVRASQYGMWQVSPPTAVAPMSGAKSPAPPTGLAEVPKSTRPGASTAQPAAAPSKAPELPVKRDLRNTPTASSPSQRETEPVKPSELNTNSPKSAPPNPASQEAHRPGDFVASLQEKLQRAQQSKPSPQSEKAAEPAAPLPQPAEPTPTSSLNAADAAPADKPVVGPAIKAKPALPQAPAPSKTKSETAPGGLRSKFRQWLHPTSSPSDRRRAARRYVPGMVAHYFTGGAPKPKNVADISMSGMYLLTDDRWMPGTMIQMTLQKPCASGEKKQSINVLSRIVRRGSDGVAAEFIMPEALPHISHDIQPSQATDKFALARFL